MADQASLFLSRYRGKNTGALRGERAFQYSFPQACGIAANGKRPQVSWFLSLDFYCCILNYDTGLDAYDVTPVLDIKPYPDWERGRLLVVAESRVSRWLMEILERRR